MAESSRATSPNRFIEEIRANTDFPAAARVIQHLQATVGRDDCSSLEVASTILQDTGVSAKVLRAVNSAFYNPRGVQVSTVTRAVFLLGFETIRDLATGIVIMEQLVRGPANKDARDSVGRSLFCGLVAQHLSTQVGCGMPEEAYLLGLFANCGLLWLAAYHPEAVERAHATASAQGIPYEDAIETVTGAKPAELAAAIVEASRFPETYADYFQKPHPRERAAATTPGAKLAAVVDLAGDWVKHTAEHNESAAAEVARRFEALFALPPERFTAATAAATKAFRPQAAALGIDPATIIDPPKPAAAPALPPAPRPSDGPRVALADEHARPALEMIAEIAQSAIDGADINQVLSMVLEGIARAGGFDIVLLALLNPKKDRIVGRLGYGADVQGQVGLLGAPVRTGAGALADCVVSRASRLIPSGTAAALVPPRQPVPGLAITSLLACPLIVRDKAVGAVVAARSTGKPVAARDLGIVQLFCNQASLALGQFAE